MKDEKEEEGFCWKAFVTLLHDNHLNQYDQIWRNFASLVKSKKVFGNFLGFIYYL